MEVSNEGAGGREHPAKYNHGQRRNARYRDPAIPVGVKDQLTCGSTGRAHARLPSWRCEYQKPRVDYRFECGRECEKRR